MGTYPDEYANKDLPEYPNVLFIHEANSQDLGDEGDIQMNVNLKTLDQVGTVQKFFDQELQSRGYNKRPGNAKLEELQAKGAPYNESNFYYGYFQNQGRVMSVTAISNADTTNVSIMFMGS